MLAVSGPGFLVAVGYRDPGNWGADLAGGETLRALVALEVGEGVDDVTTNRGAQQARRLVGGTHARQCAR